MSTKREYTIKLKGLLNWEVTEVSNTFEHLEEMSSELSEHEMKWLINKLKDLKLSVEYQKIKNAINDKFPFETDVNENEMNLDYWKNPYTLKRNGEITENISSGLTLVK